MEYDSMIQSVLDDIDRRICENIRVEELARRAGYSTFHFSRVFMALAGTPVMSYVTRRKLEYAQYDLSQGGRIIDVAMNYGFDTHAGFTKAFKKCFGYPPSLHRLHIIASPPERAAVSTIREKHGGLNMQVQIKEMVPFTIVGYTSRHMLPGVSDISDIPGFWDKVNMEYGPALSTLHHTYENSHHCEVAVCFDVDEENSCFTYMLGVGVDEADAAVKMRPGTYRYDIPGGLYAVFTTPPANEGNYVKSMHEMWKQILEHWLPESKYEYDTSRIDYELTLIMGITAQRMFPKVELIQITAVFVLTVNFVSSNRQEKRNTFQNFGIFFDKSLEIFLDIPRANKRIENVQLHLDTINIAMNFAKSI